MKIFRIIILCFLIISCNENEKKEIELNGDWVNSEYIEQLKKESSINKADTDYNFFVSLYINDSNIDAIKKGEMEGTLGKIENKKIKFFEKDYPFEIISKNEIFLLDGKKKIKFIKLDKEQYEDSSNEFGSSFTGKEYLDCYLIKGEYYNNLDKEWIISFGHNNKLSGYYEYTKYYPSAYFNNDVVLFRKNLDGKGDKLYIVTYLKDNILLEEVQDIDNWDEENLIKTGKKIILNKTKTTGNKGYK